MRLIKGKNYLQYSITLFIIIQLLCFALLGFWIYWFVSNDAVYTKLANLINPELMLHDNGSKLFVYGLILITLISTGLIFIFIRLIKQTITNRIYDGFIANITHELKSPLASIQLGIETLQKRRLPEDKRKEFLDRMATDIKRLDKLIGSILEISIIDSKAAFFEPVIIPADSTIKMLLKSLCRQFGIEENSVLIEGNTSSNIKIDPAGLETVLCNLIDNSVKYSDEPVKIKIRLDYFKKKYIITFSDEGIGIAEKDQKRVFNKFTRLKRADSPSVKGTGIGLYWCRQILKIHRGKIYIEKQKQRNGTTFKIEIPATRMRYHQQQG